MYIRIRNKHFYANETNCRENSLDRVGDVEGGHIKEGEENNMFVIQLNKLLHFLCDVQAIQSKFFNMMKCNTFKGKLKWTKKLITI